MASLTARPYAHINNGWTTPENLEDSLTSTEAKVGSTTNVCTVVFKYDLSSIPDNAFITQINMYGTYQKTVSATLSLRFVTNATSTSSYTQILEDEYNLFKFDTATTTVTNAKLGTSTWDEEHYLPEALNNNHNLLAKGNFCIRLYGKKDLKTNIIKVNDLYFMFYYYLQHHINLQVSPSGGGSISVTNGASNSYDSPKGNYREGATLTITATPNSGYTFDHWSTGETSASIQHTVTQDTTLTAYFTPINYTISYSVYPSSSGTVSGAGSKAYGSTATLTATPNTGYSFHHWEKNNTVVSNSNPYSFTVTGNEQYVACFESTNVTITFNSCGGSSVSSITKQQGDSFGTLPTPVRTGYEFTGWTNIQPVFNGGYLNNNQYVTVSSDYMYDNVDILFTAYMDDWSQIENKQLISCTEGGGWGIGGYAYNDSLGYKGVEFYIEGLGYRGLNLNFSSLSPGWHKFYIFYNKGYMEANIDNEFINSYDFGDKKITYNKNTAIFIGTESGSSPSSPENYYFNSSIGSVIIGNDQVPAGALADLANETIYGNTTLYATWRPKYCSVTSSGTNGSTLISESNSSNINIPYGESITLNAIPNTGYKFIKWSDNNTNNIRSISITEDKTYTAIFERLKEIYIGTTKISNIYIGTTPVKAVYIGTTKVFENPT